MKKISIEEYVQFSKQYSQGEFPRQRFGQAFMYYFYSDSDVQDPDLFYAENWIEAVGIIWNYYIIY